MYLAIVLAVLSAALYFLGPWIVALILVPFLLLAKLFLRWLAVALVAFAVGAPSMTRADLLDDIPECQFEECELAGRPAKPNFTSRPKPQYNLGLTIGMLPATGFAQLFLHEGAHAVIPVLRGHDARIRLFPRGGRLGDTITSSRDVTPVMVAMPMIVDLVVIVAVPLILDECESTWVASWLQSWRLAATADLVWNLTGVFRGRDTDASRLATYAHARPGVSKIVAVSAIALTSTFVAVTF